MTREELPFVDYESMLDYRDHYRREYCHKEISTHDGIRVYFRSDRFSHAFFEDGDTLFSEDRARRIGWIRAALTSPFARHFVGWDKSTGSEDLTRRVAVLNGFVVVLKLR